MSKNVADFFACDVFNDEVMKARLPKPVYKAMTKTRKMGTPWIPPMQMLWQMPLKTGRSNTVQPITPTGSSR